VSGPVLVTGGAGFAGSHLIEHLAERVPLVAWSRSGPRDPVAPLATWARVDLLDRDRVRAEMARLKPARIFHCAGAPHVGASFHNRSEPLRNNVLATHYLLDAVRRAGVNCRVVITGSATVYAPSSTPLREDDEVRPASPYGLSKLAQEMVGLDTMADDGLEIIVTRSFNHTGPRQSASFAAPGFAEQIARIERGAAPPVIHVGNIETVRDLTDVRDTVRAYALLMERGTPGTVYNVASGVGRSIRDVLDALTGRSQVPVEIVVDETRLRPQDTPVVVGDSSRLRHATGWEPSISFDRMMDDLLAYWRGGQPA
jgi:GDP-4-dehydro-6-deoxy-D-mannose reductase